MREWLRELDDLLRGSKTHPRLMAEGTAHIRLRPLVLVSVVLAVIYGVCMGSFAVFNRSDPQFMQLLASGLKVPALFFLTILVTFPSLYVFGALLGVRLGPIDTLRLVVAPVAVTVAVLASFALITLFFTFCTTNYHFMKLLNFVFFAAAGLIGLRFLMVMLQRLEATPAQRAQPSRGYVVHQTPSGPDYQEPGSGEGDAAAEDADDTGTSPPGLMPWPAPPGGTTAGSIFRLWIVLYALVGAQMGWVLRPFIGTPHLEFTWFRAREANIFIDLARTIWELLGGS